MATMEIRPLAPGQSHPLTGPYSPVSPDDWSRAEFALGARIVGATAEFAVYSRHASRVLLEIHHVAMGEDARHDYWMAKGSDDVWRARLADVPPGALYGYRCWGPNWEFADEWRRGNSGAGFLADVDAQGNRFNPNKLLFDPYARELSHDRETPEMKERYGHHAGMYGSGPGLYVGSDDRAQVATRREFDTGRWAPKAVVIDDRTPVGEKPRIPQKDAIIYEAHVLGLTRHPSAARLSSNFAGLPGFEDVADVPTELRGTYAGAARVAKYLKALGITTVELLPVHEFANDLNPDGAPGWDRAIDEPPHGNYWGYMTYGFFAPDTRYSSDKSPGGATREFKQMVSAFHDEGLEVYLDVVFNHTGEGGLWGGSVDTAELLSMRGLDNADYYALTEDPRYYWESTGCGNNLDASQPVVKALIMDSLRYWSNEMGVDGFRFDLATVLGRSGSGHRFEGASELLRDIAAMAEREQIEVIAEAWDISVYALGEFPRGWAEWNGAYRDSVRRFLKGDGGTHAFLEAVNGDYERFNDQGGPQKSVNFVTAHDGFTLLDLVSYNARNNGESWPFGPSDGGADDNLSWDSGGDQALRRARLRNFVAVLFLSRGVPMIVGGDEFGRTQNGNNNPYKIDSIGMWLNWGMVRTPAPTALPTGGSGRYHDNYGRDAGPEGTNGLFQFHRFMIGLRRAHPALRQDRFADFELDSGDDVTYWFKRSDGVSDLLEGDRSLHWRIDGSAVGDVDFLVCVNMDAHDVTFAIPAPRPGSEWRRIADTATWAEQQGNTWPIESADVVQGSYGVHAWSVAIFQETAEPGRSTSRS